MTLHPDTIHAIRSYWSDFLGCAPDHFDASQSLAVTHAGLGDYQGIWCFRRGHSLLVSVPTSLAARRAALLAAMGTSSDDVAAISAVLGRGAIERVIGPAVLSYADSTTFHAAVGNARLLGANDMEAVTRLRAACAPLDWEHGGGDDEDVRAGVFVGKRLVSLASYSIWDGSIAHIAIVTHPRYRGRHFGTAAVSALGSVALQRGLVLQYRTLESNIGSLAIARALGFVPWATTLAVRLRTPKTSS